MPLDAESGQCLDHPGLELLHETAHVMTAPAHVQHHVDDPLTGAVIGVLSAALAGMDRKAIRVGQILDPRAGPRRVKRRMFQQPDRLGRGASRDGGGAPFHLLFGFAVIRETRGGDPFYHLENFLLFRSHFTLYGMHRVHIIFGKRTS